MQTDDVISRVTVRCQFCERLFKMVRPLFFTDRDHATCPACQREAEKNAEDMGKSDAAR